MLRRLTLFSQQTLQHHTRHRAGELNTSELGGTQTVTLRVRRFESEGTACFFLICHLLTGGGTAPCDFAISSVLARSAFTRSLSGPLGTSFKYER